MPRKAESMTPHTGAVANPDCLCFSLVNTHFPEQLLVQTVLLKELQCPYVPVNLPATPISCQKGRHLAEQFATASRLYAEAVALLTCEPAISHIEYYRLVKAAEESRQRSEAARIAFEEHVKACGCGARSPLARSHGAA